MEVVTVITPTADRPDGMRLAEYYMTRQTRPPDKWIVVDDGIVSEPLTLGQRHIRRIREPGCTGVQSFCRNLVAGLQEATGDIIVFWENDDWYAPTHLARLLEQLAGGARIAGDDQQRYYHVGRRCWRRFNNIGASLCQTAIRRELVPLLLDIIRDCLQRQAIGVDQALWRSVVQGRSLVREDTVVGTKGLPGRPGLGIGHRPDHLWTADPELETLASWIGDDVNLYAAFGRSAA